LDIDRGDAPLITIRVGGVLHAAITVTATDTEDRLLVEATWTRDGKPGSASAVVDGAAAQTLAHEWADHLAAGQEPTSERG